MNNSFQKKKKFKLRLNENVLLQVLLITII